MHAAGFLAEEGGAEHELGDDEQVLQLPAAGVGELPREDVLAPLVHHLDRLVQGTTAICKCNGELIGKPITVPEQGTIGLQSEYGEFAFRRIRIKE